MLFSLKHYFLTLIVALLIPFASASAQPALTLQAPSTVMQGETLTVNVVLSGLQAGEQLDSLAATVNLTGAFSASPVIATGSIIPDPLDDSGDVALTADSGLADYSFLTFGIDSVDHISDNGLFFSFDIDANTLGSGAVEFDFVDATFFNASDPNNPTPASLSTGASLNINVVAIPEPTTAVLVLLAFGTLFGLRRSSAISKT